MQPTVLHVAEDCLIYPYNRLSTLHHLHASFEILVPFSGDVRARLDNQERTISPGEMLVLFPGVPHSYSQSDSCEGLMIIFSNKMLFDPDEDWTEAVPAEPVLLLNALDRDVAYCVDRLTAMADSGAVNEALAHAYLSLMFVWLLPALRPEKPSQPVSGDLLYRAMQYMSQNLSQPLSLKGTAHALGVNTYYLSHVLNERLHMGFRAYLNALRIDKARRYLRVTSRPIEEIAAACGFTNLRTFDRVFFERCGCPPREFRKAAATLRNTRMQKTSTL